jgi:hypothetical protein
MGGRTAEEEGVMPRNPKHQNEPDVPTLVKDVVDDTQRLLGQQMDLLRSEVRQGLERARSAAVSLGTGAGLTAAGGLLSTFMLVHGLNRATRLPLWACYGVVGGLLGAAGLRLLAVGRREAQGVRLVPEQTVEALQENLSWLKDQANPAAP